MAPITTRGDGSSHHKCIGAAGITAGMRTHECATRKTIWNAHVHKHANHTTEHARMLVEPNRAHMTCAEQGNHSLWSVFKGTVSFLMDIS